MIDTAAYSTDGEDNPEDAVLCAEQFQRNMVLRNTEWFDSNVHKYSCAATKLYSLMQGHQCLKTNKSGGRNFMMRCASFVNSIKTVVIKGLNPWPEGSDKWSIVKRGCFKNKWWFHEYWGVEEGRCMYSRTCCLSRDDEGHVTWRILHGSELSHHEDCTSNANMTCAKVLACHEFCLAV